MDKPGTVYSKPHGDSVIRGSEVAAVDAAASSDPSGSESRESRAMIGWYRRQSPSRRVLWILAAVIAAAIAVNGASIFHAVMSWTGPVARDAHKERPGSGSPTGKAARPHNPDWQVFVAFAPDGPQSGEVDIWASDAEGIWISGAEARAKFVHTRQAGREFEIALPQRAPGKYSAKVDLPLAGQWDVDISISHGDDRYRISRRIQVP